MFKRNFFNIFGAVRRLPWLSAEWVRRRALHLRRIGHSKRRSYKLAHQCANRRGPNPPGAKLIRRYAKAATGASSRTMTYQEAVRMYSERRVGSYN